MRIVFMGTPGFAVPSLDRLVKSDHEVVAVITATDKLGGRGRKQLLQSAVKKYAIEHNIPVLQPPNLKNKLFVEELRGYKADLQIVVAFRMLPVVVWDMPELGTYNLHGSLLPRYRGAAPINWAIINGDTETGVTTFKLKHEIDTGSIAHQEALPIYEDDNVESVHDRMKELGAEVVLKTVNDIANDTVTLSEQDSDKVTKAPKIFHDDCKLDASDDVKTIYNKIRGLSPYPTAWTQFDNKKLKVFKASYSLVEHDYVLGEFIYDRPNKSLRWSVSNGYIDLEFIQLEGRKRMVVRDFMNAYNLKSNELPFTVSD